ncbi:MULTISPECIES: restriction endonuclease subunit S [Pseudomonas]|uniref:restriction endonuclease subunit S n=1 Tax=Pseudomonas TaxID=286 RepID=UPI001C0A89AD|nr:MULTISPECIES: restriction endonuclease subunit S [Pseudomonas]MCK3836622.1 4'-phosphopantetheinyl transferase [Pseudomonas sp. NCIMB 10586]VCU65001.1 Type-1 restriction enzyme StySJI specificity protein [Pseudomonas synxantha]
MTSTDIPANWLILGFDEVFSQISISGKKVKSADVLTEGKFPVVDQGRNFISGYLDDANLVVSENKPLIIFGDHTREVKWIDFPFIPGADGVQVLKPHPEMDTRFLYFFLRNLPIESRGYARHFKIVKDAAYLVPPFAEQTRIAAKLDELIAQVDNLKARIDGIPALLKRFRQSVLAAALSGRLTEEWRSKNLVPRETGIQLMAETADRKRDWSEDNKSHNEVARVKKRLSEFAEKEMDQNDLPASWCWAELEDVSLLIADCHNKTAPYEKDGIPLIRTSNIRDGSFLWTDLRYVNEDTYRFWSRRCVPEPGDIVFTREAPMGEAAIIPEGKIICLGQRTMLIRCIEECTSAEFVLLALRDPKFKVRSEKLAVGTGVKHYRVGDVSDLLIPVPTKAEQTEIVRRVKKLFTFADQLEARAKAAQTRIDRLTQTILAKAFRGELVLHDPNDEPASVLLDRIKAQRAAAPKAKRGRRAATLG